MNAEILKQQQEDNVGGNAQLYIKDGIKYIDAYHPCWCEKVC